MKRLEDELRWALQRREPPAGFADRVLARLPKQERTIGFWTWLAQTWAAPKRWAPALAAALILIFVAGTWQYKRVEQRREGERAKRELIYALQITSVKLQSTKSKLLHNLGGRTL